LIKLREFLIMLTKRRGQAKKAIIDMVQWCMSDAVLNKLSTREERYQMLERVLSGHEVERRDA
jgi:hypothetical protein